MTAQCTICGKFKTGKSPDPVRDAMTERLEREVLYLRLIDAECARAVERELAAESFLEAAE